MCAVEFTADLESDLIKRSIINQVANAREEEVLTVCAGLEDVQRSAVLNDFEFCKGHFAWFLSAKLLCWTRLL